MKQIGELEPFLLNYLRLNKKHVLAYPKLRDMKSC